MLSSSGASVTARLETDPPPAKSTTRLAHALQLNQRKNDEGKYELLKILSQEWYQQSQAAFQYQCTNRHVEQFLGDHPCIDLAEAVITDPNSPVHLPVVINHDASDMEEVSAMTELLDYKVRFGFALDNATHLEERAICRPYHIAGHPCDQHIICADNDHQQEDISQYCQLQQHLSTVHNKFTNVRRFQRIQMEDDSMPVNENLDQDIHPPEGDLVTGDMTLHLYTLGMTYQMMKQAEATISIYDVFN